MESTETMESRLKRVDMHNYFLDRINIDMENGNYIEASWLIYSCFENRYFRTLDKFKRKCKYCKKGGKCRKNKNELALRTKVNCVKRLYDNSVECICKAFTAELFEKTLAWIKERNTLMHELLSLEFYEDTDERFKKCAETGLALLSETYLCCTKFRELFYTDGYEFVFPINAMEGCTCKNKKEEENEQTNQ
ncbi:MAG: hypothetical protein V3G42_11715 [Oscillospiraceae bacterium]